MCTANNVIGHRKSNKHYLKSLFVIINLVINAILKVRLVQGKTLEQNWVWARIPQPNLVNWMVWLLQKRKFFENARPLCECVKICWSEINKEILEKY